MKPMGDQLLLKAEERQEKTKSGLILKSSESEYGYAKVIAVGPGIYTQTGDRIAMSCKEDDTVLVPNRLLSGKNGNEVTLDDKRYILVRESEIVMKSI